MRTEKAENNCFKMKEVVGVLYLAFSVVSIRAGNICEFFMFLIIFAFHISLSN